MGTGGGEFDQSNELFRQLQRTRELIGNILRPDQDPIMLHLDGRLPVRVFRLMHGEVDTEPSDHPLVNPLMQTFEGYRGVMVSSANSLLQEFSNALQLSPELRASLRNHPDELQSPEDVTYDHAVARMNGFDATSPEPVTASIWSVDLIGGSLDGVMIDRFSIYSANDRTHLLVISRDDQVRFSFIHDRTEHPLTGECAALFGPGPRLYGVLAGVFEDEDHLDSILSTVEEDARGFVPEDEARELLGRVREAALLVKEREALAYLPPTLGHVNAINDYWLGSMQ